MKNKAKLRLEDKLSVSTTALSQRLTATLDLIEKTLKSYNIRSRYYGADSLLRFHRLNRESQIKVLEKVSRYANFISQLKKTKIDVTDNKAVLKYWLSQAGLRTLPDYFDTLSKGDIIEVYNMDGIQVFRSREFLYVCNYDLLDIEMHEWPALYERNEDMTSQLLKHVAAVFQNPQQILKFNVPTHPMREIFSHHRQIFEITHKYIAPIFAGKNIFGFVCNQTAQIATDDDPGESFQFIKR